MIDYEDDGEEAVEIEKQLNDSDFAEEQGDYVYILCCSEIAMQPISLQYYATTSNLLLKVLG